MKEAAAHIFGPLVVDHDDQRQKNGNRCCQKCEEKTVEERFLTEPVVKQNELKIVQCHIAQSQGSTPDFAQRNEQ